MLFSLVCFHLKLMLRNSIVLMQQSPKMRKNVKNFSRLTDTSARSANQLIHPNWKSAKNTYIRTESIPMTITKWNRSLRKVSFWFHSRCTSVESYVTSMYLRQCSSRPILNARSSRLLPCLLLPSTSVWHRSPFLQTSWFRSSYITFRSTESYRSIAKWELLSVILHWGGWYAAVCEKLKVLYDKLKTDIPSCPYIQVDESTIPVIDNVKSKTRKGYMWCVRDASGAGVFFHYDMGSRGTQVAMSLLKDYRGAIQSDGYNVYNKFSGLDGKTMLGCWAHARRKFADAMKENERLASEALVYIGDLYHIEPLTAGLSDKERMQIRKEKSYPQILKFEDWMQAKYFDPSIGPLMRTAIEYTFKRLPKLSMYVNDGSWNIDNNGVENAIRPLAIGRKNYLFCGNDASAVRASMIYSFIATCKASGVEPREWLEDVIRRIPEYENGRSDVTHLLPKNWKRNFNNCNQR